MVGEREVVAEASSACATASSWSSTRAPAVRSTLRSSACAQTAPNMPVLAPATATGLSRRTFAGNGREAQSSAFLSAPGMEALYSGVAMSRASADAIAWRSATTRGDGVAVSSILVVGGEVADAGQQLQPRRRGQRARRRPEAAPCCSDPARRLPEMPRSRIRLAVLLDSSRWTEISTSQESTSPPRGQLRLKGHAPVAAIDRRSEVEARRGAGRRGPRSARGRCPGR